MLSIFLYSLLSSLRVAFCYSDVLNVGNLSLGRMADNEVEENASRGNEWEVVSLTASTYAAAPSAQNDEPKDDARGDTAEEIEAETSRALFMSRHFVFPPGEHENLPVEPELVKSEIYNESEGKDVVSELGAEVGDKSSGKDDEDNWTLKDLSVHNEFPEMQIFDERGNRLSFSSTEFEEGTTLPGLNLTRKEESIYSAATFSSFHGDTALNENLETPELTEPSEQGLNVPADASKSLMPAKEDDKFAESDLPCEAWWKRRAASLYAHAKETNTFWSIFIAAAVMGIVIIGQQWQQERWQALQLKWQLSINDEVCGLLFFPRKK